MKNSLSSNIKKSIKIIAEDKPDIPSHLIEIIDEEPDSNKPISRIELLMRVAAQQVPWFYRDSTGTLQSPQSSFFGFYALRNILRGTFLSLRFIQAGDLLRKNNFLAASIFSYYTASFHLLNSFLAIHGRVIVDIVHGPIKIIKHKKNKSSRITKSASVGYTTLDPAPEIVMAIHTKQNKWVFESRARSHSRRWKELEQIFIESDYDVPEFYYNFFEYILSYGSSIHVPSEPKVLVKEGMTRLTEIRHESIYSGYGADDFVHDGLINRDLFDSTGIDMKSKAYHNLSTGLISHAVDEIMNVKYLIPLDHWNEVQSLMFSSIFTPPFELSNFTLEGANELNDKIGNIFIWLMGKVPRDEFGINTDNLKL